MLTKFKPQSTALAMTAVALALVASAASAQRVPPGGGWTYDPAIDGMKDLRAMKPIEGCNVPGGLVAVTSTDEPGVSVKFWCGPPPFCLTEPALTGAEECTVLPYSRREPRYDPNGTPGANGVRDPEDLRCTNTGLPPVSGRCPLPPTVSATLNGAQNYTATVGTNVTMSVSSPHATSLRKTCSGANFGFTPFIEDNLDSIAGQTGTVGPGHMLNVGTTTCTITASNVRGTVTTTVAATATVAPTAPTISAAFNPTNPTPGGSVQLVTRTTNATSVRWSCSGRWTNSNTARNAGTVTTNHTASGSAGSANCTFTATGAGGTATASASWTSSTGGSGSGSGGGDEILSYCRPETVYWTDRTSTGHDNYGQCVGTTPLLQNGQRATVQGRATDNLAPIRYGSATYQCAHGRVLLLSRFPTCANSFGN